MTPILVAVGIVLVGVLILAFSRLNRNPSGSRRDRDPGGDADTQSDSGGSDTGGGDGGGGDGGGGD